MTNVFFGISEIKIKSRIIEGKFPKWRNIIPTNLENKISVDLFTTTIADAVHQASMVATEEMPAIVLKVTNGNLSLSCGSASNGNSEVNVPVSYTGDERSFKFDHIYLSECFNRLPKDEVVTLWLEDKQAMLATCGNFKYILMPLS